MVLLEFNEKIQSFYFNDGTKKANTNGFKTISVCVDRKEAETVYKILSLVIEGKNVTFHYLEKLLNELVNFAIEIKVYQNFCLNQFEYN